MNSISFHPPSAFGAARDYWRDLAARHGRWLATKFLLASLWEFIRDSTPERQRLRFGDADYDWNYRVNTTSGAVGWRDRLIGTFHSAYQPTDPTSFHEMLQVLYQKTHLNFPDFTFLDLGSGKGRTLLMASDYPFQRIIGVELLPSLHEIAQHNLKVYKSESQKCFALESVCADAATFPLPEVPLILYLFNPFPESVMRRVLSNLATSFQRRPRQVYVLYLNPELEHLLSQNARFEKIGGTHQYSILKSIG
jgi:Predicted O-methyltransferase